MRKNGRVCFYNPTHEVTPTGKRRVRSAAATLLFPVGYTICMCRTALTNMSEQLLKNKQLLQQRH